MMKHAAAVKLCIFDDKTIEMFDDVWIYYKQKEQIYRKKTDK